MPKDAWPEYKSKLSGGWRLVSYELFDSEGPSARLLGRPHGDAPLGRVLISPHGWLSAHMANPDRSTAPLASLADWQTAPADEVAHVARGLSMYCGRLELFRDDGAAEGLLWWRTRVEIASDPNRVGGLQVRKVKYWERDGEKFMELRPEKDMVQEDGMRMRGVLRWQKFEDWE